MKFRLLVRCAVATPINKQNKHDVMVAKNRIGNLMLAALRLRVSAATGRERRFRD
ncbi:MAG: hypothetical protein JMDDDDMK_03929 [Acidobacteria bacterium]|nr:hypothetical protein [Acidobacteriota bacterium]